ncbi:MULTISPECIES: GNAT family N-acetyltransferase [unclassified Streptomyces]|uniref:GNAT family N-acetyltransferase n=1 Tax=unclassified Streptomyces TaxID=2593676 RepID=UPI000DC7AF6C|nr:MULTISPECIES: GNAT family N-acetyltransferase [unclassified Streptomyces]AWZ05983.1 GNAT family N-acetyltransferase [Streptomyces sp. ICC4]AWZ13535.1 GNAT family N-acetyltransferase [Streptomyces sp. ICC1]
MHYRSATAADAPAMAALFAANHHDALTERERSEQGFVQGALDESALRSMADAGGLLVADEDGDLAGLLGLIPPESMPEPPPPVLALLGAQDSLRWRGRPLRSARWLLYGPVVVAAAHRGKGVARGLFTTAIEAASGRADLVVAFIEMTNRASWRVHVDGFGMTPLGELVAEGRSYGVVGAAAPERPARPGT